MGTAQYYSFFRFSSDAFILFCLFSLIDVSVYSQSLQSCPTLCILVDCSPPGSSVHGILQAGILEWVAMSSFRGSSQPRDRTHISCIADEFFTAESWGKPSLAGRAIKIYTSCKDLIPGPVWPFRMSNSSH